MKPSLYERYLRIISMMAQGLKPTAIISLILLILSLRP